MNALLIEKRSEGAKERGEETRRSRAERRGIEQSREQSIKSGIQPDQRRDRSCWQSVRAFAQTLIGPRGRGCGHSACDWIDEVAGRGGNARLRGALDCEGGLEKWSGSVGLD